MREITKNKSAASAILVSAVIICIIIAGVIGAYYLIQPTNPSNSPTTEPSTETPSTTPSSSPQSPASQVIANFEHTGANLTNYVMNIYDGNGNAQEAYIEEMGTNEGTYNGTACWLLRSVTTFDTTARYDTLAISKDSLQAIHLNTTVYSGGTSTSNQTDIDPAQTKIIANRLTQPVDQESIVGYETVTVNAGTFTNCAKAVITDSQVTANIWVNPDVPLWGIVKMEVYSNQKLIMSMQLDYINPDIIG